MTESKILIDWIQFTILKEEAIAEALQALKQKKENFEELKKGCFGYKKQMYFNNIKILWDGTIGMGTCVSVSGQGCRYLEAQGLNLFNLLYDLKNQENINITRFDLTLDYSKNIINLIYGSISENLFTSKSKSIKVIEKIQGQSKNIETIYIGSRSSNIYLRIYDKQKEANLSEEKTRIEFEIKKDYTKKIIELLEENINKTFYSLLYSYFRPLEKRCKNITRSPTAAYWQDFLKDIEKIKIYEDKKEKTIEEKFDWLQKQVAPTMALLCLAFNNTEFLQNVALNSVDRIKDSDKEILKKFIGVKNE